MSFSKKISFHISSYKRLICRTVAAALFAVNILGCIAPLSPVHAADYAKSPKEQEQEDIPVESNNIKGWPEGPEINAESAILMEMDTHTILYAKNIDAKMYPASTTKILTCLLAAQYCNPDDVITFSDDAINDTPGDAARVGWDQTGCFMPSDTLNLEQALYCVLVKSANEVASALGEHVAESVGYEASAAGFSRLMNEKAKALGCKNSHFVNANGLFNENHYTTAYDLALIGCEFFGNELLSKISSTPSYHFTYTGQADINKDDTAPSPTIWLSSKNQLFKGSAYAYPYLLGSKTGFVSQSRQTLVSGAKKDGMSLVCVVFKEETPFQFEDTITLFNYGFENFHKESINENEKKYQVENSDLFITNNDLFGASETLISLENDKYVILPDTADFDSVTSRLSYVNEKNSDSNVIAKIEYTYNDTYVGECDVIFTSNEAENFSFSSEAPDSINSKKDSSAVNEPEDSGRVVYINIKILIFAVIGLALIIIIISWVISLLNDYNFSAKIKRAGKRHEKTGSQTDGKKGRQDRKEK